MILIACATGNIGSEPVGEPVRAFSHRRNPPPAPVDGVDPASLDGARGVFLLPGHRDALFDFSVTGSLDESIVRTTVQDITGTPPRTYRRWVETHAGSFA